MKGVLAQLSYSPGTAPRALQLARPKIRTPCTTPAMPLSCPCWRARWPLLQTVLRLLGSGYLVWLGVVIARSAPLTSGNADPGSEEQAPWALHQAVLFQFINPKAWLMSISAIGSFTLLGDQYWPSVVLLVAIFCLICLKTCLLWAQFGVQVGRWLRTPLAWQRFNLTMGLLTAACVVMIWR